ncbi:MAG: nicotinate phosphoribosyltransferase [Anaerolineae bacterium]|nr:nicotinate phosphoribosyltransferase [Anaerolineae bacterium]MDQ7034457.1 nicotinate phosphoribosyltransferase [Anaerolineae bacterium]
MRRCSINRKEKATAEGILFTDQYQLTMAQLYYRQGIYDTTAQFDHFFRSYPNYGDHQAGYAINAGLQWLVDWMQEAHFRDQDLDYMRGMTSRNGNRIFEEDFLAWLKDNGNFSALNLYAIPEGRVVHPSVPLTMVVGPLGQGQLLETQLLNQLNYQTLIATKAARIHQAGRGGLMMEFGARRAHGSAALAGARAALIGGADFTSNAGISHALGFPPKGTHAHSMIQVFMALGGTEIDAFRAYADTYPDDCLLLVDTIDTLHSGMPNAIIVFEELRKKGYDPVGIRLDSGDLAHLSVQAAKMLNDAGFDKASIVLSNNLDELILLQIITQIQEEAPHYGVEPDDVIGRLVYGVGTRLITSAGSSALDGVYKLVAVQKNSEWLPAMKISENPEKVSNPGHKKAWRIYDKRNRATADLIGLADENPDSWDGVYLHHPAKVRTYRSIDKDDVSRIEPLHVEVMRDGKLVYEMPTIQEMREVRKKDIALLDLGVRRIMNPHIYHVSLTEKLWDMKQDIIQSMRV